MRNARALATTLLGVNRALPAGEAAIIRAHLMRLNDVVAEEGDGLPIGKCTARDIAWVIVEMIIDSRVPTYIQGLFLAPTLAREIKEAIILCAEETHVRGGHAVGAALYVTILRVLVAITGVAYADFADLISLLRLDDLATRMVRHESMFGRVVGTMLSTRSCISNMTPHAQRNAVQWLLANPSWATFASVGIAAFLMYPVHIDPRAADISHTLRMLRDELPWRAEWLGRLMRGHGCGAHMAVSQDREDTGQTDVLLGAGTGIAIRFTLRTGVVHRTRIHISSAFAVYGVNMRVRAVDTSTDVVLVLVECMHDEEVVHTIAQSTHSSDMPRCMFSVNMSAAVGVFQDMVCNALRLSILVQDAAQRVREHVVLLEDFDVDLAVETHCAAKC